MAGQRGAAKREPPRPRRARRRQPARARLQRGEVQPLVGGAATARRETHRQRRLRHAITRREGRGGEPGGRVGAGEGVEVARLDHVAAHPGDAQARQVKPLGRMAPAGRQRIGEGRRVGHRGAGARDQLQPQAGAAHEIARRQKLDRRGCGDGGEHIPHQPHVVIQRQPSDAAIAFAQPQPMRRDGVQIGHHRRMADRDALGRAGGARGELHIGDGVGRAGRRQGAFGRIVEVCGAADEGEAAPRQRRRHPVERAGGRQRRARRGDIGDARDLLQIGVARAKGRRRRHRTGDQPGVKTADQRADEVGVGLRRHADPVSRRQPPRQELRAQRARLRRQPGEAQRRHRRAARAVEGESTCAARRRVQRVGQPGGAGREEIIVTHAIMPLPR